MVRYVLTRRERPLFALNVLIPLKFRGTYAALAAPPNPPSLPMKLLKKTTVTEKDNS